ncbi:MAG: fibronectin type III domain-containing protein, partial [Chloroflexi bacterium]|nr:fibronectin type III domain-containing protein [Chloroflexota bacterium]
MQLRAKNAHGTSAAVSLSFTTLSTVPPPKPTNVQTSGITHNRIILSWTKSPGATSYEIDLASLDLDQTMILSRLVWTDIGDVASYTFTGLHPNA